MRTDFELVGEFNRKFRLPHSDDGRVPDLLDRSFREKRLKFLREEVDELELAYKNQDLPKAFDALLDIAYVALGAAHFHALPWAEGMAEVQRANMAKVLCVGHRIQRGPDGPVCCKAPEWQHSSRNPENDVLKPPGWEEPDLKQVLKGRGWRDPADADLHFSSGLPVMARVDRVYVDGQLFVRAPKE